MFLRFKVFKNTYTCMWDIAKDKGQQVGKNLVEWKKALSELETDILNIALKLKEQTDVQILCQFSLRNISLSFQLKIQTMVFSQIRLVHK